MLIAAGEKDEVALHWTAVAAHQRIGTYWHMLPEATQARKAIWEAVNPLTGRRRIDDAFPHEIREVTRENEMFIRFKWGSTWQVVGSDNYRSLVGTPPVGLVLSEWAKAHPGAWAYLMPILVENDGWALAITTPEGRNHAHSMYEMARADANWHAEVSTADDTGAISGAAIEQQRKEYHAIFGIEAGDALIEQEFYCSWNAAILGAYWGKELERAEREGRICKLEPIEGYPIETAWDIGVDDPMAIWVFQRGPGWLNIIDYVEGSGHGFDFYCRWLDERGYHGGADWVPHDAKQREPGAPSGRTRIQTLMQLGRNPRLVPNHKLMDRINAGRRLLPRIRIDEDYCQAGINCLRHYRAEWDQNNRTFRRTPLHDWSCFVADTKILTRYGMHRIIDLPQNGEVWTPWGFKKFKNLGKTGVNAQLVEVKFKDGLTVKCTPEHLFLTEEGWKSAESLRKGSIIQSSLTRSPNISMADYTEYGRQKDISQEEEKNYIETYGELHLEKSQKNAKYITKMRILKTTILKILNVFQGKSIGKLDIQSKIPKSENWQEKKPLNGTDRMKADCGIGGMPKDLNPGQSGKEKKKHAKNVEKFHQCFCEKVEIRNDSAQENVELLIIESVEYSESREDVYDIEVENVHCFSLSNGAVVHNSHGADAFGYLAVAVEIPEIQSKKPASTFNPRRDITVNDLIKAARPDRKWT